MRPGGVTTQHQVPISAQPHTLQEEDKARLMMAREQFRQQIANQSDSRLYNIGSADDSTWNGEHFHQNGDNHWNHETFPATQQNLSIEGADPRYFEPLDHNEEHIEASSSSASSSTSRYAEPKHTGFVDANMVSPATIISDDISPISKRPYEEEGDESERESGRNKRQFVQNAGETMEHSAIPSFEFLEGPDNAYSSAVATEQMHFQGYDLPAYEGKGKGRADACSVS